MRTLSKLENKVFLELKKCVGTNVSLPSPLLDYTAVNELNENIARSNITLLKGTESGTTCDKRS